MLEYTFPSLSLTEPQQRVLSLIAAYEADNRLVKMITLSGVTKVVTRRRLDCESAVYYLNWRAVTSLVQMGLVASDLNRHVWGNVALADKAQFALVVMEVF